MRDPGDGDAGGQPLLVWLEPLAEMAALPASRAGLLLTRKAPGAPFTIAAVADGSPAAEAQLKAGDAMLALGGRPASELSRADAQAMLLQPVGTVVALTVGQPGSARTIPLPLRELTGQEVRTLNASVAPLPTAPTTWTRLPAG